MKKSRAIGAILLTEKDDVPPSAESEKRRPKGYARVMSRQRGTFLFEGRVVKMKRFLMILIILAFASMSYASQTTASWYSSDSCKREGTSGIFTASGERFNEMDLTAAMWGVKFGTRVEVVNISNGKKVIVRINDRGPSKKLVARGRVIDLSKGAFMKIASLRQGVINVRVRIIAEDGEADLQDDKGNYWFKSEDGRYYYDNKGHYLFTREEDGG